MINKLDKKWKPGIQGKNLSDFTCTIPFNFKQDGAIEVTIADIYFKIVK